MRWIHLEDTADPQRGRPERPPRQQAKPPQREPLEPTQQERLEHPRRDRLEPPKRERLEHSPRERLEITSLLSRPGCVLCREGQLAVDRFFFWYIHEHYGEAQALLRVERSCGFCREHTGLLLERAGPSTVGYVYGHLLRSALERLREAERQLSSGREWNPAAVAEALMPRAGCPACMSRADHEQYLVHLLRRTVSDPEVNRLLRNRSGICLGHFLQLAPSLDRQTLRLLAELLRNALLAGSATATQESGAESATQEFPAESRDEVESLGEAESGGEVAASALPDAPQSPQHGTGAGHSAAQAPESQRSRPAWSPALDKLRQLLATPGCPIDAAQRRALEGYLAWLAQEVRSRPSYAWNEALWLCRRHLRDFHRHAGDQASQQLARATAEYWAGQLGDLLAALRRAPPQAVLGRLGWVFGSLRTALRPGRHVLREVRERYLRGGDCPACRYLDTVAERTVDLLVRGLGDPATLDAYEASSGVCFRHLPRLVRAATSPQAASHILRVQRVRLEVLQWELAEFDRKQNWAVRYEPLGPEGDACRRAANHYSGAWWGTLD